MSPYDYCPLQGKHVATIFYILFGWLLFNLAFAVGMYFRPKRKQPIDLIEGCTSEDTADLGLGLPGSTSNVFAVPTLYLTGPGCRCHWQGSFCLGSG
jgi:hypothetical protein